MIVRIYIKLIGKQLILLPDMIAAKQGDYQSSVLSQKQNIPLETELTF